LSDESPKETTDTKRLEIQIENLRCAVITLILVVSLLAGYIILQYIQQLSIAYLFDPRLYYAGIIIVLLLWAYSSAKDKG
jgi:hypothetical protein